MTNPPESKYQPLLRVAVAVASGMVADRYLQIPLLIWLAVFAAFAIVWRINWQRKQVRWSSAALLICIAAMGGLWHNLHWNWYAARDIRTWAQAEPSPVMLRGRIVSQPKRVASDPRQEKFSRVRGDRTRIGVRVTAIRKSGQFRSACGNLMLFVDGKASGSDNGDLIEFCGKLSTIGPKTNPGEFDFQDFFRGKRTLCWINVKHPDCLKKIGRGSPTTRLMSRMRVAADGWLWRYLADDYAALASAMLLGNRQQLDPLKREQFLLSGTVHLLAISGLHVGILASLLLCLPRLGLLPRRTSLALTVVFVFLYAWLVEFRPPVVRAGILVSVFCYCRWVGRKPFSFNSLAMAALVVLAINPTELFAVGAQLSFLAVATMIFARQWLHRPDREDPIDRLIRNSFTLRERMVRRAGHRIYLAFAISGLIWLLALPMVASTFHVVAPIALLANPLILIPVATSLIFGMGVLVFGGWAPPVALLMGKGCQASLWTIQTMVDCCQTIPFGHWWTAGPPLMATLLFYGLLLFVFLRFDGVPFRVFAGGMLVWIVVGWFVPDWSVHRNDDSRTSLECTMADVGHGGCVLLELPGGQNLLYDCGSLGSPANAQRTAAAVLWSRRIRHIDTVVISHADSDHFNGLPYLARQFSIGKVVISDNMLASKKTSPMIAALLNELRLEGIPVKTVCQGDCLMAGGAVNIEILNPPKTGFAGTDNAASIVLDIKYHHHRILLPGDLENQGLDDLLKRPRATYDLVMAPHHGSDNSRPAEFLRWSQPRYAVVSCGQGKNTQLADHVPEHQQTEILHTGSDGAIRVEFTEKGVVLRRWKYEPW